MAYCTKENIQNRLPDKTIIELTDDEKLADEYSTLAAAIVSNGSIEGRIDAAIEDADAMIDGWLRRIYSVPLSVPIPGLIKRFSIDLSIWNLFDRKSSEFELPASLISRHDTAMKMLDSISKGETDLGVEPTKSESAKQVGQQFGDDHQYTTDDFSSY